MTNVTKLAKDIESGNRPSDDIDITQFFIKLSNGEYVPDMSKRIQVRNRDRDVDFVERTVNKIEKTGDRSKLSILTTVFFPKTNAVKLLNGNHTVEIELGVGMIKAPANSINFDTELGGKMSLARRLGNLLNRQEVEKNSTSADDVKGELYEIMGERIAAGKDAKPSEDEIQELIDLYPFVSRPTIGQWISYHQQGGSRRAPLKSYSKEELKQQKVFYTKQRKYRDYIILEPRTLGAWESTGVAQSFIQCKNENKTKVLVPFYCASVAESEKLEKGEDVKITNFYKELGEHYGLTFEVDFLSCE
tara:strand:- start:277 stop:1188 length:912 start_codon:yes stop_codon:yes gene_type:complete